MKPKAQYGAALLLLSSVLASLAGESPAAGLTLKHPFGPKQREFTFSFEFVPLRGADRVELDRIVVRMPTRTQALRTDFSVGVFQPKEMQDKTRFVDLNGDGFDDLLVPTYSSPMGNNGFFVWVYLPASAEFIYSPELSRESNIEPKGNGLVETYSRDGGPNRTSQTFRWTGKRFDLISIYRHEERGDRVFETLRSKKNGKWIENYARPLEMH